MTALLPTLFVLAAGALLAAGTATALTLTNRRRNPMSHTDQGTEGTDIPERPTPARATADTITDDQLDALYDQLARQAHTLHRVRRLVTQHSDSRLDPIAGFPTTYTLIAALRDILDMPTLFAAVVPTLPLPTAPAPLAAGLPLVQGRCPACAGSSLFLANDGYVTCSRIDCPEPDAATTLLEQQSREQPQAPLVRDLTPPWPVALCEFRQHVAHPGETCEEVEANAAWLRDWCARQFEAAMQEAVRGTVYGRDSGEPLGLLVPGEPTPAERALAILQPHLDREPLYRAQLDCPTPGVRSHHGTN